MRDRIRESRTKRDPQNDKHRLDTCFESRQQLDQIDLSDINDGKQETIEQHARDQRKTESSAAPRKEALAIPIWKETIRIFLVSTVRTAPRQAAMI